MPRFWLGVLVLAAVVIVFGLVFRWMARASERLSHSGRQMKDWDKW